MVKDRHSAGRTTVIADTPGDADSAGLDGVEPIPGFAFNPPTTPVAGFETMELAALRRRVPDGSLERVHRVAFHALTLITEGTGGHTVDFVTHPCRPGTLLWVRPGQVQRFGPAEALNGTHLLFTAAFPPLFAGADHLLTDWYAPVCRQLGAGREYTTLSTLLAQLTAEYDRPAGSVSGEILRYLLAAVLLQIDRLPHPDGDSGGDGGEVYARFCAELERSYATTRRAEDYARHLGFTVKTLTRACVAATGQSVKQVIDGRVGLEAQRLLAHTDAPVGVVSRRLGFSQPTNFGKFFIRLTGATPGDFRREHRGPAASGLSWRTARPGRSA
ncbi:AraC family transcriptional regulator [Streptomyces sp. NPDC000618]|uniref:helix-turn-helix domain-containing protein n=1 Tax=Streptomyces sp. NPDC000618 TaxID=3154265 RepID=UPI0033257B6C